MTVWPNDRADDEGNVDLPVEVISQNIAVRGMLDQLTQVISALDQAGGIAGLDSGGRMALNRFAGTLGYRVRLTKENNRITIENDTLRRQGWFGTETTPGHFRIDTPEGISGVGTVICLDAHRPDLSPATYRTAHTFKTDATGFSFVLGRYSVGTNQQMILGATDVDVDLLFIPDIEEQADFGPAWPAVNDKSNIGDPDADDPGLSLFTLQLLAYGINIIVQTRNRIDGLVAIGNNGSVLNPTTIQVYNACRVNVGGSTDRAPAGWTVANISPGIYNITYPTDFQNPTRLTSPVITCRAADTTGAWTAHLSNVNNAFAKPGSFQVHTYKHVFGTPNVTRANCAFDLISPCNLMTVSA